MNIFNLAAQCCDANEYLDLGALCASTGDCYHALRPMGAIYWFSIPYRLGMGPGVLVFLHLILTLLSIMLSVKAMTLITKMNTNIQINRYTSAIFILGSSLAHLIFLMPAFSISLSDAPASLLFLIGLWVLLLGNNETNKGIFLHLIAGLCFGLSVWMRLFFIYPVVISILLYIVLCTLESKRTLACLMLLSFMIPIGIQLKNTHGRYGIITMINPETSMHISNIHLNTFALGYDTVNEGKPKIWESECSQKTTMIDALHNLNIQSMLCFAAGRLNFYLGSYSPRTYTIPSAKNFPRFFTLDPLDKYTTTINTKLVDHHENLPVMENVPGIMQMIDESEKSIGIKNSTKAKTVERHIKSNPSSVTSTLELHEASNYLYAIWLWKPGDEPHILDILVRNHQSNTILATKSTIISPTPNHVNVQVKIDKPGLYDFVLDSKAYNEDSIIGRSAAAAGVSLNTKPYYVYNPVLYKDETPPIRYWSKLILLFNCLALLGACIIMTKTISAWRETGITVTSFFLLVCGMALVIVPEQRFVIAPMIMIWIFFFVWIATILPSFRPATITRHEPS